MQSPKSKRNTELNRFSSGVVVPSDAVSLRRYAAVLPPDQYNPLRLWINEFYPFQKRWLLDYSPFAICNKARQIGTSFSTAAVAVLWGAFHGEMTTVVSMNQMMADEVLEKCHRHVRVLQRLGSRMANTVRSNASEIMFAGGGRIVALDSKGARSFSGNVFLDEFAYQPHATAVWDASAPVALLGKSKIRVVSTPNGVGNEFHDIWEQATDEERIAKLPEYMRGMRWSTHEIPIALAIQEGYPVDITKCWTMAKGDARLFEQFFNCSFLDGVLQYIPSEVINDSLVDYDLTANSEGQGLYYAGLDIGREVDLSALVIIKRVVVDGVIEYHLVHVETIKRTDSDGLDEMVDAAFAKYKIKRLCIDGTGLGTFPSDRIKKRHSERYDLSHRRPRVDVINFGPKSKEELATGLYAAMTGSTLKLPSSEEALPEYTRERADGSLVTINEAGTWKQLKREIASLQRVITKSANIQYITPHTREGHADRAWALMLAVHGVDGIHPMLAALTGVQVSNRPKVPPA